MFSRKQHSNRSRGAVRNNAPQTVVSGTARRWIMLFLLLGVLTAAVWYGRINWQPQDIPLGHVSINGAMHYLTQQEVQQVISDNLNGGYFTVDLYRIRDALLELPWMQEASIRRVWPSGLRVELQEKTALAYWGDESLLSSEGEVFTPATKPADLSLPQLSGPDGLHKTVWQFMTQQQQQFAALGLQIKKLVLDKRRAWQMQLIDGTVIRLGRGDIDQRLQRFNKVFAMSNAPALNDIEIIDMRYPNGFALFTKTTNTNREEKLSTRVMTHVSEA